MKILAITGVAASLLLAACSGQVVPLDRLVVYTKDPSTGLCFAGVDREGNGVINAYYGITYVPCTPEVEARIEYFKQFNRNSK